MLAVWCQTAHSPSPCCLPALRQPQLLPQRLLLAATVVARRLGVPCRLAPRPPKLRPTNLSRASAPYPASYRTLTLCSEVCCVCRDRHQRRSPSAFRHLSANTVRQAHKSVCACLCFMNFVDDWRNRNTRCADRIFWKKLKILLKILKIGDIEAGCLAAVMQDPVN